jgi:transglutaminase-like putative cysteine protease
MYVRFDGQPEKPGLVVPLAGGELGTDQTVDVMAQLVRKSLEDPATKQMAVAVTQGIDAQDPLKYVRAVWSGVRAKMRYVPDVYQVEELTSPAIHSRRILSTGASYGDCDDFSMLGAAWLLALGVPARFEVVASPKNGGKFDHVRVAALTASGWLPLETTVRKVPFGGAVKTLRMKTYSI